MNQKASLVSLAVDKAWADAANAEEAKNNYLEMINLDGMIFNPIKGSWGVGKDSSVNYIIQFTKR